MFLIESKNIFIMRQVTKEQYEYALKRIEGLLPLVEESTPRNDSKAIELSIMSDVVIEYEKCHYSIERI